MLFVRFYMFIKGFWVYRFRGSYKFYKLWNIKLYLCLRFSKILLTWRVLSSKHEFECCSKNQRIFWWSFFLELNFTPKIFISLSTVLQILLLVEKWLKKMYTCREKHVYADRIFQNTLAKANFEKKFHKKEICLWRGIFCVLESMWLLLICSDCS